MVETYQEPPADGLISPIEKPDHLPPVVPSFINEMVTSPKDLNTFIENQEFNNDNDDGLSLSTENVETQEVADQGIIKAERDFVTISRELNNVDSKLKPEKWGEILTHIGIILDYLESKDETKKIEKYRKLRSEIVRKIKSQSRLEKKVERPKPNSLPPEKPPVVEQERNPERMGQSLLAVKAEIDQSNIELKRKEIISYVAKVNKILDSEIDPRNDGQDINSAAYWSKTLKTAGYLYLHYQEGKVPKNEQTDIKEYKKRIKKRIKDLELKALDELFESDEFEAGFKEKFNNEDLPLAYWKQLRDQLKTATPTEKTKEIKVEVDLKIKNLESKKITRRIYQELRKKLGDLFKGVRERSKTGERKNNEQLAKYIAYVDMGEDRDGVYHGDINLLINAITDQDREFSDEDFNEALLWAKEASLDSDSDIFDDLLERLNKLPGNNVAKELIPEIKIIIEKADEIKAWIDTMAEGRNIDFLTTMATGFREAEAENIAVYVEQVKQEQVKKIALEKLAREKEVEMGEVEVSRTNTEETFQDFYTQLEGFLSDDEIDDREEAVLGEVVRKLLEVLDDDLSSKLRELGKYEESETNYIEEKIEEVSEKLQELIEKQQEFSPALLVLLKKLEEISPDQGENSEIKIVKVGIESFKEAHTLNENNADLSKGVKSRRYQNLESSFKDYLNALGLDTTGLAIQTYFSKIGFEETLNKFEDSNFTNDDLQKIANEMSLELQPSSPYSETNDEELEGDYDDAIGGGLDNEEIERLNAIVDSLPDV